MARSGGRASRALRPLLLVVFLYLMFWISTHLSLISPAVPSGDGKRHWQQAEVIVGKKKDKEKRDHNREALVQQGKEPKQAKPGQQPNTQQGGGDLVPAATLAVEATDPGSRRKTLLELHRSHDINDQVLFPAIGIEAVEAMEEFEKRVPESSQHEPHEDEHGHHSKKKKNNVNVEADITLDQQEISFLSSVSVLHVTPPPYAYLMIISNEDFVDGALVLGTSLRTNSEYIQQGKAHLAILVAHGRLGVDAKRRLRYAGFDRIVEVTSLAPRAPGAYWKDTYDKLYMFNLTAYQKVVFMDADMLNINSADKLFEKNFGGPHSVGAIGHHGHGGPKGKSYFQTGMMVIEPSLSMFSTIMEEFESGVPPRGRQYNHGMGGRDGVLLRNVFRENFKPIDDKYSRNLNPRFPFPKTLKSLHFRGKHKPWFNQLVPNEDPELGKKEFGFGYRKWWDIYEEEIHEQSPEFQLAQAIKKVSAAAWAAQGLLLFIDTDKASESPPLPTLSKREQSSTTDAKLSQNAEFVNSLPGSTPVRTHGSTAKHVFYEFSPPVKTLNDLRYALRILHQYGGAAEMPSLPDALKQLYQWHAKNAPTKPPPRKLKNKRISMTKSPQPSPNSTAALAAVFASNTNKLSPLFHFWMMRRTKREYVQYTSVADASVRSPPLPSSLQFVVGDVGASCKEACKEEKMGGTCHDYWLYHTKLQSCDFLTEHLDCKRCEPGVYWRQHPGHDYPAIEEEGHVVKGTKHVCFFPYLHDDRTLPDCGASNVTVRRLCPCERGKS